MSIHNYCRQGLIATTNVDWPPLSQAAIVSRELSVPTLAGYFIATSVLKTGDYVRVNEAR